MISREPRFLCDEMLKGLGRWLRVAGYDTLMLADRLDDAHLLRRARQEGRLLITRDRPLGDYREADGTVVLLQSNGLPQCAAELTRRLDIDWLHHPFSRCSRCNTPLSIATSEQRRHVPADARNDDPILYCPVCDRLYWQGGHVRRMRERLRAWARGDFRAD